MGINTFNFCAYFESSSLLCCLVIWVLYILWILIPCQVFALKMWRSIFNLSMMSFERPKVDNVNEVHFIYFFFCWLRSYWRNYETQKSVFPHFSQFFLSVYNFVSSDIWVFRIFYSIYYQAPVYSFAGVYQIFLVSFIDLMIFCSNHMVDY